MIADAADANVRRIMEQHRQYVEDNARGQFVRARCGWLSLQTDQPYVPALHRFFKMRASS
jgi:hypothetical protein